MLCSIGNITMEKRKSPSAWFFYGLLPNHKLSSSEMAANRCGIRLQSDNEELYHSALCIILSDLVQLQREDASCGNGVKMHVHGKGEVFLHFELALVIGDTVGHDAMCGQFKSYSNKIQCPIQSCDVGQDKIDDPDHICNYTKQADIQELLQQCMFNVSE